MRIIEWFTTPRIATQITRHNFINTQWDAVGVGIASTGGVFLPVFLSRLNASSVLIGLLLALPSITGLFLAIPAGRLLQRQENIIPWYSYTRAIYLAGYTLSGLITLFTPKSTWVPLILIIWALISIPQTILSITFNVVMNHIAGEDGRFELMTRRWSLLSVVTALFVFLAGQLLEKVTFPLNYQIMFIVFSLGGVLAFIGSNALIMNPTPVSRKHKVPTLSKQFLKDILAQKPFVSVVLKRFVFLFGVAMIAPLFPLYYVREAHVTDATIALISTVQTGVLVFGYFFWMSQSRRFGTHVSLLLSTLGLSFYPLMISLFKSSGILIIIAGIAGVFQAGVDLVFFDELMKTIPSGSGSTYVALAQESSYVSAIVAPLLGTFLADRIGYSYALMFGSFFLFVGFLLFAITKIPFRVRTSLHTSLHS